METAALAAVRSDSVVTQDAAGGRQTGAQSSDVPVAVAVVIPDPAAPRMSGADEAFHLPLSEILLPWLDVFRCCTTKWGLVTDVREDGSQYTRHGIIVEVSVDITSGMEPVLDLTERRWKLLRIRQGIELVKLALAVVPHALMPLLLRQSLHGGSESTDDSYCPELDKDDLQALTRDRAPFELRMKLEIKTRNTFPLSHPLVNEFMEELDQVQVEEHSGSPTLLRRWLIARVQSCPSTTRRLMDLPVLAVLDIELSGKCPFDSTVETQHAISFFGYCAAATEVLRVYQERRAKHWQADKNYAPVAVASIELALRAIPLTAAVMEVITSVMAKGIPVSSSTVCLDLRFVSCPEPKLQTFLQAVTRGVKGPIYITTGPIGYPDVTTLDGDGEDFQTTIWRILRCIGMLEGDVRLEIGSTFYTCDDTVNRRAIMRGLLQFVLTRASLASLSFQECVFHEHDTILLLDEARQFHRNHPTKQLRLRSFGLLSQGAANNWIRAFLRVLDDLEEVSLHADDVFFNEMDVETILRFPSLRSVSIEHVSIPTMDIFRTSAPGRAKPSLESLKLNSLTLQDPSSMVRFIESLDPRSASASVLVNSLHTLQIAETDRSTEPTTDDDPNRIRLALNHPSAAPTLERVLTANKALRYVNFYGDFASSPAQLATEGFVRPAKRSVIHAAGDIRQKAIVKARQAAFLSAIRDASSTSTLQSFDSELVKMIFDFAAPHAFRKIRV